MNTFDIDGQFSVHSGGSRQDAFMQNVCGTCKWQGVKHYAHNDYQVTNCIEERNEHKKKRCKFRGEE